MLTARKTQKAIKEVKNILEKKSLIIYKKLKSFVGLLFLAAKVISLGQAFCEYFYNILAKRKKNLYLSKHIKDDLL